MGLIENPKTYTGRDLETIFFRPMLTGDNAEQIGIRVLYNMPVPTTIQMWSPAGDILKPYSSGWTGGDSATRKQKTITMQKIKAETGYSASDYFSQVYELITGRPDVNMDDLSGTELDAARSLTTAYRWSTSTYRSICPRHSSTHRSACSQTDAT